MKKSCHALQYAAIHYSTLQHTEYMKGCTSEGTATHCNTLQHTATHCNTLQHTATHCNALQHTALRTHSYVWHDSFLWVICLVFISYFGSFFLLSRAPGSRSCLRYRPPSTLTYSHAHARLHAHTHNTHTTHTHTQSSSSNPVLCLDHYIRVCAWVIVRVLTCAYVRACMCVCMIGKESAYNAGVTGDDLVGALDWGERPFVWTPGQDKLQVHTSITISHTNR